MKKLETPKNYSKYIIESIKEIVETYIDEDDPLRDCTIDNISIETSIFFLEIISGINKTNEIFYTEQTKNQISQMTQDYYYEEVLNELEKLQD